jgi:hypothetical protein
MIGIALGVKVKQKFTSGLDTLALVVCYLLSLVRRVILRLDFCVENVQHEFIVKFLSNTIVIDDEPCSYGL